MPSKSTSTNSTLNHDAVRTRAYLMWEADGRPFGHDAHYWNLALAEMTAPTEKPKRAAASSTVAEKKAKPASKPAGKTKKKN